MIDFYRVQEIKRATCAEGSVLCARLGDFICGGITAVRASGSAVGNLRAGRSFRLP